MDLEKETGFQRTENKRQSEEEERKEKPESWSLRAGTTSRLPRGGLKGPPGQGSQRAVLSQGHACGGAGGEGGVHFNNIPDQNLEIAIVITVFFNMPILWSDEILKGIQKRRAHSNVG